MYVRANGFYVCECVRKRVVCVNVCVLMIFMCVCASVQVRFVVAQVKFILMFMAVIYKSAPSPSTTCFTYLASE